MKKVAIYGSLLAGLMAISAPLYAQGLFPGVEIRSMQAWIITFGLGILWTIMWFVVKRFIGVVDNLNAAVMGLTRESLTHRGEASRYGTDINILKRRANKCTDWINKHNLLHAKCPMCPDEKNDLTYE